MGGADVHDQLRLQRYSLQLAVCFKNYYKSLFLGLVDLALVNAFIVYNHARIAENKTKVPHVAFTKQLHLDLCQISPSDWEGFLHSPDQAFTPSRQRAAATSTHMPVQTEDPRKGDTEGSKKCRQWACKACSLLKDKVTGGDTSYKCSTCVLTKTDEKTGNVIKSPVYLCNKVKHSVSGQARTCFKIWHSCWRNGALRPTRGKCNLRVRAAEEEEVGDNEATTQCRRVAADVSNH